jgi:hypothetical protein
MFCAFWVVVPCVVVEIYDVSEAVGASVIRATARTAPCYKLKDSHLYTRCRENLKSYLEIRLPPGMKHANTVSVCQCFYPNISSSN